MSILKVEDEKKWLNAFVAIGAILLGYVFIKFFFQLGEWFDLESKVPYFNMVAQGLGIAVGFMTYLIVNHHKRMSSFLSEVYGELIKVVWPNKDSTFKLTIGIIISVTIVSIILVIIDIIFKKLIDYVIS